MAYTIKFIWQRRNEFIFQNKFSHPSSIILKGKYELHCYTQSIPQLKFSSILRESETHVKWQKPPPSIVKMNWDAASDQRKEKIGLWEIIRNSDGLVVGSLRNSRQFINNPSQLKL